MEEQFDRLAAQEAAGMAAFAWHLSARSLRHSPLFGRSGNAALSRMDWQEWVHPDDRAGLAGDWERALAREPLRALISFSDLLARRIKEAGPESEQ